MARSVFLIPGTHAWDPDDDEVSWFERGSTFMRMLRVAGIRQADAQRPFVWDTDLGGIGFGDGDLHGWYAAGYNFAEHARRIAGKRPVTVVSHSHGLQPALFAADPAVGGLRINTLIDVCGPVRKDMRQIAEHARPNIGHWIHYSGGRANYMQLLGQLFDGDMNWGALIGRPQWAHPLADENIHDPRADHGSWLHDEDKIAELIAVFAGA